MQKFVMTIKGNHNTALVRTRGNLSVTSLSEPEPRSPLNQSKSTNWLTSPEIAGSLSNFAPPDPLVGMGNIIEAPIYSFRKFPEGRTLGPKIHHAGLLLEINLHLPTSITKAASR